MLTKLLPDQISKFWDIIKYAVEQSLPPIVGDHPDKMNRILSSLLSGGLDCWASYEKGEVNKFECILLTKFLYDDSSDTRNLLIYCIYGYNQISKKSWESGLVTLLNYAKGNMCNQIVAYTDIPHIVKISENLGAEDSYTFITFNVNKTVQKLNSLE